MAHAPLAGGRVDHEGRFGDEIANIHHYVTQRPAE
jgi:hypothetical protein